MEAEPSGYSINYKNFAEVIYLYYLNKEGLTPAEKLSHAENVIDKIKNWKEAKAGITKLICLRKITAKSKR